MADVQQLFEQFIAEDRGGAPADPGQYLAQVRGTDRAELEALLDGYLARAPRRSFNAEAFADSPARSVAEGLTRTIDGQSGLWPSLLPQLRHRARLKRADVVERLAAALGVEAQSDRIGGYYHAMEQGLLPANGVSDRVLEALSEIIGSTAAALREAGRAAVPGGSGPVMETAFARIAAPNPAFAETGHGLLEDTGPAAPPPDAQEALVDELFTGASDGEH